MHSLLCCGILRVPSHRTIYKKKQKNVEIFSHMPIIYKVISDTAGLHYDPEERRKKKYKKDIISNVVINLIGSDNSNIFLLFKYQDISILQLADRKIKDLMCRC